MPLRQVISRRHVLRLFKDTAPHGSLHAVTLHSLQADSIQGRLLFSALASGFCGKRLTGLLPELTHTSWARAAVTRPQNASAVSPLCSTTTCAQKVCPAHRDRHLYTVMSACTLKNGLLLHAAYTSRNAAWLCQSLFADLAHHAASVTSRTNIHRSTQYRGHTP